AGAGLVLLGGRLAEFLYHDAQASAYVRILGFAAPFMYLESMVDGILKGLGEQMATFRYSVLDSALRIAGIALLVPRYGMNGFLGVMIASNLLTCTLNTARMIRCLSQPAKKQRPEPRPDAV
ncbi:MAG: polysaccharide biosynthesis C-terminal domain-containing protein, partial [Gemmiger sp.]